MQYVLSIFIFNDLFIFYFFLIALSPKNNESTVHYFSLAVYVVMPIVAIFVLLPSSETDVKSATVLPANSDSDVMLCLQSYQGLIIDSSLKY